MKLPRKTLRVPKRGSPSLRTTLVSVTSSLCLMMKSEEPEVHPAPQTGYHPPMPWNRPVIVSAQTPASERLQSLATANRLLTATTKTAPPRKSTRFAMIRVIDSPM